MPCADPMLPPLSREEHPADALSASVQLRRFPLRLDRPPMLSNRLGPVPAHLYWKERSPSQMPIRREGTMRHSQKNGAVFRSEERRVGKECVRTSRSGGSTDK